MPFDAASDMVPPPNRLAPPALSAGRKAAAPVTPGWFARRQVLNAVRSLHALSQLRQDEFGPDGPSASHIRAANRLVAEARAAIEEEVKVFAAPGTPGKEADFADFLRTKDRIKRLVRETEKLLAFYRSIFLQRADRVYAPRLRAMDRIALDCYQAVWLGLGKARSVPAPTPFTYIEDGAGPATFRRGVTLIKLGRRPNPFPLVRFSPDRLDKPWSLGAAPHETVHNMQDELGMWPLLPDRIRAVMAGKLPEAAIEIWARLHKESYADLVSVLLIGPAYVESLMDVVGKRRRAAARFDPDGVHPNPIVRVPLNCALLRRMGFAAEARGFEATWSKLYPPHLARSLPAPYRTTLKDGIALMVEACCYREEAAYGGKALAEVVRYSRREQELVAEAADRLLRGETTGVLPERFLISAAAVAIRKRPEAPDLITRNFYRALGG